ncbi:MAG: hypothetical protein V4591_01520, partial [Bdellovibrionota bacterium]
MTACTAPSQSYYPRSKYSSAPAVSEDARVVEEGLVSLKLHKHRATSQNNIEDLKSQLFGVYSECSYNNWDGYGARQITKSALNAAFNLADLLPEDLIEPEAVPEPSGNLGIEWINSNGSRFLLAPLTDGLVYAGIIGRSIIHGQVKVSNN